MSETTKRRRGRPKGSKTRKPVAVVDELPPLCPKCGAESPVFRGSKPRIAIDAPTQQQAYNRKGRIWRPRKCTKCGTRFESCAPIPLEMINAADI